MVGDVFPPLDWQGADLAIGPIVLSATKEKETDTDMRAWLTYDDGTVWPVEVTGPSIWPGWVRVVALSPAPDAGLASHVPQTRLEIS